jgi:hypothetical protein
VKGQNPNEKVQVNNSKLRYRLPNEVADVTKYHTINDSTFMTEFQPATRALEEMLKRSFGAALKDEKRKNPVGHQGSEPRKFDKLFHTVIIPDEESFDFPVIEWCDDDENVVKTDDSQHRSLYQSQNGNCIASRASVTDDCRRNVPCLMRCRSILADLAVLGTLGMEIPCSSSTSERTPTSYAAFGID